MPLTHRSRFIRDEHETELADDRVKGSVRKRKRTGVRLLPADTASASKFCFREFEHVWIEIGRDDFRRGRQRVAQPARHDSRAAGNFENAIEFLSVQAKNQAFGVRLEKPRTKVTIIIFRDRSCEDDVAIAFHYKLGIPSAQESRSTRRRIEFHHSS